jgi:hypothetical protein
MDLIRWNPVKRKRSKDFKYTDAEFVRGYDIDMPDFTELVTKYNTSVLLPKEENRLSDYVLTLMQIVTENPKINPQPDEISDLADAMFLDIWNALHYIKPNTKPYSYLYRAGYTCACRFFKKKITERQKAEEINAHVTEEYVLYHDSVTDHKVRTNNYD